MPVKSRRAKRRIDEAAEVKAWSMLFNCGWDYLHELEPFGLHTDGEARAAAPEAWNRLGEQFLATWKPDVRPQPWALERFGNPKRKARNAG